MALGSGEGYLPFGVGVSSRPLMYGVRVGRGVFSLAYRGNRKAKCLKGLKVFISSKL